MSEPCALCGAPSGCTHHLIGGANRKKADQDGLTIRLCHSCHNLAVKPQDRIHGNPIAEKLSKMLGQAIWEKNWQQENTGDARAAFRERYGRSWL